MSKGKGAFWHCFMDCIPAVEEGEDYAPYLCGKRIET